MPTFRQHARACVNGAITRALESLRPSARAAFFELVAAIPDRALIEPLANLARVHRQWLRPLGAWPRATGHPLQVIHALASHLLGRYPVPRFLASVWFGPRGRHHWFILHARGVPFRRLRLPVELTRAMEHELLRACDHVSVDHALRYAEVIGVGGSEALARTIVTTRLGRHFDHGAFWRTAIAWFARREAELDLAQVGPIVDYLHAVRNEWQDLGDRKVPPPQPDLSLIGRTFASLMRLVVGWHRVIREPRWKKVWTPSKWRPFVHEVQGEAGQRVRWSLVELADSTELTHEGKAMRHCVSSYAARCSLGECRIWSLRRRSVADGELARIGDGKSVLTLDIDPRRELIVDVRGFANARPSGLPLELVRTWAARERLQLSAPPAMP